MAHTYTNDADGNQPIYRSDLEEIYTLSEVLELCADAGYDGIEFLHRFRKADPAQIQDTLDSTGLSVPYAHLGPFVGLDEQSEELERTIESYATVDCSALAVSVGDEAYLESAERIAETARKLESLAETAAYYDIGFLYHNHHSEFQLLPGTDTVIFDALMDEPGGSVSIERDTCWVTAGGDDPVERLGLLGDRTVILHLKDVSIEEKSFVEIGSGDVYLQSCADAAQAQGVGWFVYEHDEPADPLASLETGAEYLDSL